MKRLILPALVVMGMTGCIIYEEDVIYEEEGGISDGDGRGGDAKDPGETDPGDIDPGEIDGEDPDPGEIDGEDPDQEDPEPVGPAAVILYPSGGEVSTTVIVSVVVNIDADVSIDLNLIKDITFYGDSELDIVAAQIRNSDEYLLVIDVGAKGADGDNDLLIEFEDGTAVFVHDAFEVVPQGTDAPADFYAGDECPE